MCVDVIVQNRDVLKNIANAFKLALNVHLYVNAKIAKIRMIELKNNWIYSS